jgi:uncharacterized cupin superfamily protein
MPASIVIAAIAEAELEPMPVPPGWILAGAPEARARMLAKSHDGTSYIVAWECTAGRFHWHYDKDETAVVVAGEVFVTTETGPERRLGEGDMGFFPAGSSAIWRVPDRIKKVAVLRRDLPRPLGFGLRAWHRLRRLVALEGRSSLSPAPL